MNYYNFLCETNRLICKDSKVREPSIPSFKIINYAIKKTLQEINNEKLFLTDSLYVASLIKLFQPFYDGNHRTALITFGRLLNEGGYDFDYVNALEDMKNHKLNIPTIYFQEDKINNLYEFEKYIVGKTVKENNKKRLS